VIEALDEFQLVVLPLVKALFSGESWSMENKAWFAKARAPSRE